MLLNYKIEFVKCKTEKNAILIKAIPLSNSVDDLTVYHIILIVSEEMKKDLHLLSEGINDCLESLSEAIDLNYWEKVKNIRKDDTPPSDNDIKSWVEEAILK